MLMKHVRGFVQSTYYSALMALHENNIVHCDVKGDNIFIAYEGGKYIVKLGVSEFKINYTKSKISVIVLFVIGF